MTKDDFARHLRDKGYRAANVDGCVTVFVSEISKAVKDEIIQIVKDSGYVGSYGWKKDLGITKEEVV